MKIAVFNNGNLGVVKEDRVYDITKLVNWNKENVQQSLVHFMESFEELKGDIEKNINGFKFLSFSRGSIRSTSA